MPHPFHGEARQIDGSLNQLHAVTRRQTPPFLFMTGAPGRTGIRAEMVPRRMFEPTCRNSSADAFVLGRLMLAATCFQMSPL